MFMRKSSASNRIRLENKCISFVLVLSIGLIGLAPCMAVQEFVLLEGRSASISSYRSVVEINESLFEGLA